MGIKNVHLILIIFSILLALGFGAWNLGHHYTVQGYLSFLVAVVLVVYCVTFIKRMKAF